MSGASCSAWSRRLLWLCSLASGAVAQPPLVLADGRSDDPTADMAAWQSRGPVRQAIEAARAYWSNEDASYEEDIRFFDAAEGVFTSPGAQQSAVLFLMSPWPRCCSKMGLAIVEGDRLVDHVAFEGIAQTLRAIPDLDGDGLDELVATGEFGMGGQTSRSMTLMSFRDGHLRDWGGTGIYDSDCAAGQPSGSTAARVVALPGPTFTLDRYVQPDCESATWTVDGAEVPLVFEPPPNVPYVELPLLLGTVRAGASGVSGDARSERGRLEPGDQVLTSGEFVDEYAVACRREQPLTLDLRAADFDPYLMLGLPDGEQLDNDDHEGDRHRSLIATTPTQDGPCRVVVTSFSPGETGAYELLIRLGGDRP